MQLFRCPLAIGCPSRYITGISRLLSAISTKPGLVSISGCPASLVRALDSSGLFTRGVKYPFRFDVMSLQNLMYQQNASVFGNIDFFSQIKYLLVFLSDILVEPWALETPDFTSAIETCKLKPIPSICTGLLASWKAILDYLTEFTPTQVNQRVKQKVISLSMFSTRLVFRG